MSRAHPEIAAALSSPRKGPRRTRGGPSCFPIRQAGFGAIAAIMILVILAALSAAIVSVSTASQMGSAQDMLAARAWQLAQAGTEYGLRRALKDGWCGTADWPSPDDAGFNVNVACSQQTFNDGETAPGTALTLRVFTVTATACNGASCPDATAARAGYVERQRIAMAYCEWNGATCTP